MKMIDIIVIATRMKNAETKILKIIEKRIKNAEHVNVTLLSNLPKLRYHVHVLIVLVKIPLKPLKHVLFHKEGTIPLVVTSIISCQEDCFILTCGYSSTKENQRKKS